MVLGALLAYTGLVGNPLFSTIGQNTHPSDGPKPANDVFRLEMQRCKTGDDMTLHGLWPEWAEYCDGDDYDKTKMDSIRDRLR